MPRDPFEHIETDRSLQDTPLVSHLAPFATSLVENGYVKSSVQSKLSLLASFGQWLKRRRLSITDFDEQLAERFIAYKRRTGRVDRGNRETLLQFLDHLRKRDAVPGPTPTRDDSPLAAILTRYEKHLRSERGLAAATVINYLPCIRKFLIERFREKPLVVREVRSSDVSDFLLRHAPTMSPRRAQLVTAAFRSFFRFLFQNGELQVNLALSVPSVADRRLATIPKYLSPDQVERVLATCNRQTATGRRDYAILLLLARLGLRAGEVVSLQLDDVDWRAGELLVRGKGLLHDRMPLPIDVGEALTSYLRMDRPPCKTRRVFVCMKAPRSGFAGPSPLSTIVRRALDRAGLYPALRGAHVLRHSLATTMLRSGASMNEIGEILRHRNPSTTEIYAKLDFEGLRTLAHPWPSVGGGR
ncbi:MAG: tyrosine-type recombinase/integrase [Candidatus Sulfotelmatobacter sp.]